PGWCTPERSLLVGPAVARAVAAVGADDGLEQRRRRDRPRPVLADGVAVAQLLRRRPPQRLEPRRERGRERAELAVAVPAVAGDDGRRDRLRLEGGVALERGCRRASLAQFGEHGRDLVDELADRFPQD